MILIFLHLKLTFSTFSTCYVLDHFIFYTCVCGLLCFSMYVLPLSSFMAAIQHCRINRMGLSIEDVPSHVHDTFSVRRVDDFPVYTRVVDKVIRVE